ncbi:MAG: hypothetical protein JWL59_19 [Chthoniobacteraceae bacterium]|nr:hypothetical protein [Chthoniobacteraceae bacterium]
MELLEPRIAPATLTFVDLDGDMVTVKTSKGSDAELAAVAHLVADPADATHFQLQFLGLKENSVFARTDLTITAKSAGGAPSSVNVGFINGDGIDLGKVRVDGDLGRIAAGDATSVTPGLKSLVVKSMGLQGLSTQDPGTASFGSRVIGALGSLTVRGDFKDVSLQVLGVATDPNPDVSDEVDGNGKIGFIRIEGSIIGGALESSGAILAKGKIGAIFIQDSIVGGAGAFSGSIITERTIQGVSVGGSVKGGATSGASDFSGRIFAAIGMGAVTVGHDGADDGIIGGTGKESGSVSCGLGVGAVTIKGKVTGGSGESSGSVGSGGSIATPESTAIGGIGKILVTGDVTGGDGKGSGSIRSTTAMKAVNLGGNLQGGIGILSGVIASQTTIASLTVDGSIIGGIGSGSGSVGSTTPLGAVHVRGDLIGAFGSSSGQIVSGGTIKSVVIEGSVKGGTGFESGAIGSRTGLGPIEVGHDLIAGIGARSGLIVAQAGDPETGATSPGITSVKIGGSIIGKPESGTAGQFSSFSGAIVAEGVLGPVEVQHDLLGGDIDQTGIIYSYSTINSVTIHGSLKGGQGNLSGQISARDSLKSVTIDGNIAGGAGTESGAVVSAGDIGKVTVQGSVLGGVGDRSGEINLRSNRESGTGDIDTVTIKGVLTGGFGAHSGQIASGGKVGTIIVGGLLGGEGTGSGSISASDDLENAFVRGNVEGGLGDHSASITTFGNMGTVLIEGSVIGGSGSYDDDSGLVGQISAAGQIGSIRVVGDAAGNFAGELDGGTGVASAQVRAGSIRNIFIAECIHGDAFGSGSIIATNGNLGTVVIGEEIEPGPNGISAQISSAHFIESLTVGSILGSSDGRALITAVDGITKLTIKDSVHYADILAGYNESVELVKGGSQIGSVVVGVGSGDGNWEATNLVASVFANTKGLSFGNAGDYAAASDNPQTTVSRIASLIIKGKILSSGQPGGARAAAGIFVNGFFSGGQFGIEAEVIGSASVNGTKLDLVQGAHNDSRRPLPSSVFDHLPQDTYLFEVNLGEVV